MALCKLIKTNGDYFLVKGMLLSDSLIACSIDQSVVEVNSGVKFDIDIVFNSGLNTGLSAD